MDFQPYRIVPAKARETIEAGGALVIDVTSPLMDRAVRGQIPSALRVSTRELANPNARRADLMRALPELPRDKTIITYCTCPNDEASARFTRALREQGYDAWLLDGGLPAWRAAGYPMEAKAA